MTPDLLLSRLAELGPALKDESSKRTLDEICEAVKGLKPFGWYYYASNGDDTYSPDFCEGAEFKPWRTPVAEREPIPLYRLPAPPSPPDRKP